MSEEQHVTIEYMLSGLFTLQGNIGKEELSDFLLKFLHQSRQVDSTEHIIRDKYRIEIKYNPKTQTYTSTDDTGLSAARDGYIFVVYMKLLEENQQTTASLQQSAPSRQ